MSLRVIAGKARGMKLKPVPGESTRPIMDRVKEALFSIIGSDIIGANFLDLFAGTGSVGIEALSRGAEFAQFNETSGRAIGIIRANLAHTRLDASALITRRSAFQLLAQAPRRRFQYIYVAPPQYQGLWLKTLYALNSNSNWPQADCRVIVQIDPKEYEPVHRFKRLELYDNRTYGRTMLLFYQFTQALDIGSGEISKSQRR